MDSGFFAHFSMSIPCIPSAINGKVQGKEAFVVEACKNFHVSFSDQPQKKMLFVMEDCGSLPILVALLNSLWPSG